MFKLVVSTAVFFAISQAASAGISSVYSTFDFDKDCVWTQYTDAEETIGGDARCKGLPDYPVYVADYDLRQFMAYGPVSVPVEFRGGFGQFNYVNHTIEWRLNNNRPFAVIQRWFIEFTDDYGNSTDKGQVLVVSRVAEKNGEGVSCPMAYVDALSNKNANALAREAADTLAESFICDVDLPRYLGVRGPYSGSPLELAQ